MNEYRTSKSGEPVSDIDQFSSRTLFHKDDLLAGCQLRCLQGQAGDPKQRKSSDLVPYQRHLKHGMFKVWWSLNKIDLQVIL